MINNTNTNPINSNIKHCTQSKHNQIPCTMMNSILGEEHTIKVKGNSGNKWDSYQNVINSSSQSIQSMMNSMKIFESKKKHQKGKRQQFSINADNSIKDISHIAKNEVFILNDIDNSWFNENDEWNLNSQIKYTGPDAPKVSCIIDENKEWSEYYKNKIINAECNEEIIWPDTKLVMNFLVINKPIKLKGQISSVIEITEGPITININIGDNIDNDPVKISQLRIIFNDNELITNKQRAEKATSNLFKLYQGSLLEWEDCDVIYQWKKAKPSVVISNVNVSSNTKTKSVAFWLYPCKKNSNGETSWTSLLTITNTRIFNFYQTIRSGQNCILNIDKSSISQNYGKSIVIINPWIMKINETTFERNTDEAIHVKFIKDDFIDESRKFFFRKNTFEMNMGNAICFEGIKGFTFDMSIVMAENTFRYNNSDAVITWDMTYNSFEIIGNKFEKNKGNGLNIQKVIANDLKESDYINRIKIKGNEFIENYGFGLFINDCQIDATSNKFRMNKASGMILCNLVLDNPRIGLEALRSHNYTSCSTEGSSNWINLEKRITKLGQNTFFENGESGWKIINYTYPMIATENTFKENCEHGIFIDLDSTNNNNSAPLTSTLNERIKLYKNSDNAQGQTMANLIILKCLIEKNYKSGISMNNCLVFCEDTFIIDNISYAVYTSKKEYQFCFKETTQKEHRNTINGSWGGEWGEVSMDSKITCNISCMSSSSSKKKRKIKFGNELGSKQVEAKDNNNNNVNNNNTNQIDEIKLNIDKSEEQIKSNGASKKDDVVKTETKKDNDDKGCIVH